MRPLDEWDAAYLDEVAHITSASKFHTEGAGNYLE
jgi:hypothetical protein